MIRDLRRLAFARWMAPFLAALSSATTALRTRSSATGRSPAAIAALALAMWVFARLRRGAFLALRRADDLCDLALGKWDVSWVSAREGGLLE